MKQLITIFLLALGLSAAAQPAAITGTFIVCTNGGTTTLHDATPGGTWACNPVTNATIGTSGVVSGVAAGTALVTYTTGSGSVTATVTVNQYAAAAYITGPGAVCVSSSITLSDVVPSGTWSSLNPTIASVNPSSGVVTGVAVGLTLISYNAVSPGCGTVNQVYKVHVNSTAPDPIGGVPYVCINWSTGLTDDVPGGVWMSSNTAIAMNGDAEGAVQGISAGTVTYTYSTGCGTDATIIVTVDPIAYPQVLSSTSVCAGSSLTMITTVPGGTWTSSNTSVATIGSSDGVLNGLSLGGSVLLYVVTAACGTMTVPVPIGVIPSPALSAPFSGSSALCIGTTTTLSPAGSTWSSSNTSVATVVNSGGNGLVTGMSAGTATITRITVNACGTSTATGTVTVNPYVAPSAGTISGPSVVPTGSTITLIDVAPGGAWSSSFTSRATVGSTTGIVTGLIPGTVAISYTVGSACGTASAVNTVVIVSSISPITGSTNVCMGSSTVLTDATPGGTWSVGFSPYLSIGSATGIITGLWPGSGLVTYTTPGGGVATYTISINTIPTATPISGPSAVAIGGTITLSESLAGGVWSSDNAAVATVGPSGIVTGASAGTAVISYSFTSACAGAAFTHMVTVAPVGTVNISGNVPLCLGSTITLTGSPAGGTWSSDNLTVDTVSIDSGIVRGIAAGTADITYTVGGVSTSVVTTVNAISKPHVAVFGGAPFGFMNLDMLPGITVYYAAGIENGTSEIYPVFPSAPVTLVVGSSSTTPTFTSVSDLAGGYTSPPWNMFFIHPVTISYSGCAWAGSGFVSISNISGNAPVCTGSTHTLTAYPVGGIWSSSNTGIATVGSTTGVVTGIAAGTVLISYNTGSPGYPAEEHVVVTVNACGAGTITGGLTLCVSSTTSLTDATSGGVWSSGSPAIASVGSTGIVAGLASGTAAISYTVGASVTSVVVTVTTSASAGTITGTAIVCPGSTTNLTDAVGGGNWSSGNTLVATVGSSTGIVSGVAAGTATIYYAVSNSCGTATTSRVVTVNVSPSAGTITGTASVCVGSTTTFSDAVAGGTWSSASPAVATVGSTGIVNGMGIGTSTISYSVTNSCGTTTAATRTVTVNGTPVAGTITGTTSVCGGSTTALTDAATGGVWSSGATSIATVSTGGTVTGVAAGTVTISYRVTNSCGTATATTIVTVTGSSAGTIAGASTVITGTTTNLTDAIPGGVWSASNGNATVSASGVVTGVTPGTVTISYTVTSGCGALSATKLMTVNNATSVAPISGYYFYLCAGATTNFWDATTGGSWSIAPTSVATVSATGVVTGISAGIATLTYTYGGFPVTAAVTVNAAPVAITGTFITCVGTTAALADATPGGTWSSSSTTVATISTAGIVTGVMAGTSTIYYAGAGGCKASQVFTVTALPSGIGGATSVCIGSGVSLSDLTAGGAWSSTAPASVVATGTATALATGLSTGTAVITYSLGTGCYRTFNLTVKPVPAPVSGTLTACVGAVAHLSDATTPGISWTSSNTLVATISASGGVTGISAGTANMTYTAANGCTATATVTVNALPVVAAIAGPSTLSHGGGATLYTDATAGGVWRSTYATVISIGSSSGIAAAIASSGTTTISYTVTNASGCVAAATKNVSATPAPRGHGGSTTTFVGATIDLADEASAGEWISSDNGVATVDNSGSVKAISAGVATISHTIVKSEGVVTTYTTTVLVSSLPMDVRLVPNPNNGTFIISGTTGSEKDEVISLEITNMLGQVAYRGRSVATAGVINEQIALNNNLGNGIYLLNVNSEGGNKVFHFVVEK